MGGWGVMGRHDPLSVNLPTRPSPIPNPETGVPRPPHAPREWRGRNPTSHTREPRNPPPGPADLGPVLEWNQMTRADTWKAIGGLPLVLVAFLTLKRGFDWLTYWWVWVVLGLAVFWGVWTFRRGDWLAAGAVWVQQDKNWVNIYELAKIRFTVSGLNRVLNLTDSSGRTIHGLVIRDVQSNQPMWDLVYNGILHSVASGNCDISDKARSVLKVPTDLGRPPTEDHPG